LIRESGEKYGAFHPDPPGKFADDPGNSRSGKIRSILFGSALIIPR